MRGLEFEREQRAGSRGEKALFSSAPLLLTLIPDNVYYLQ